jgi:ElaB/YqjD/DUF883 family membrane-anchored ribosome-binding protein
MNDMTQAPLDNRQRLEDDLRAVVDDLERSLHGARNQLAVLRGEVVDRVRDGALAADHYVHDHPWQSIGIGAAVGVVVGVLLARR